MSQTISPSLTDGVKDSPMPFLTVFTPTYNRAHTLPDVYRSLLEQTDKDFLWLIVDDGSTDATASLVNGWKNEGLLKIRYIAQENGGKHIAFNHALDIASSVLFMCLDSDDMLMPLCVERLKYHWRRMQAENSLARAICFLLSKTDGGKWNEDFPEDVFEDHHADVLWKGMIPDDVMIAYETEEARQYRYPERWRRIYFPDKFMPLAVSSKAKFRYINERLGIYCFNPKDLDRLSYFARPENFEGGGAVSMYLFYWVLLNFSDRILLKYPVTHLKLATHYNRFADIAGISLVERLRFLDSTAIRLTTLLTFVPGRMAAWLTKIKHHRAMRTKLRSS